MAYLPHLYEFQNKINAVDTRRGLVSKRGGIHYLSIFGILGITCLRAWATRTM